MWQELSDFLCLRFTLSTPRKVPLKFRPAEVPFTSRRAVVIESDVLSDLMIATGYRLQTLEAQFKVQRSAGGSALNVLRAVQWVLKKPFVCTFMGCISSDETGAFLRNAAEDMGVRTACQTYSPLPCSMCIVLLTGTQRSLCSFQLASGKFEFDRFLEPSSQAHLEKAAFVYLSV